MAKWHFNGWVITGLGQGAGFTSLDWVREAFRAQLGIELHPGTLNLRPESPADLATWSRVQTGPALTIAGQAGACDARCFPVRLADRLPAAIVLPEVDGYADDQVELVAALPVREHLGLADGDRVAVSGSGTRAVTAAIFDVDGTLVNSVDAYHIAAGRAAAPFGYEVTREAVRQALNGQYKFWELIIPDAAARSDKMIETLRRETMRHWADVLDQHVTVLPGVQETLEQLSTAGVRLAIYTGSRGESFAPLETSGLLEYFEFVLTGAEVEQAKPHPEGVLRCLDVLGVEAGEAAYVGDSVPDMGAGQAAGAVAIGMLTGAADSAALSAAGAHRLAADHTALIDILLPD
ncbi:MAG: HAD-IA family hydrolase [Chromatiales bacterium]|nr:MAG: HAD-IA family hydrolase [Chromatiales bacterium]